MATAAIYLAHLNPMTKAHEAIISSLQKEDYQVYVFPVRFLKEGREVNTRSFPFSYELRKAMVESVFGDETRVLPDYAFHSPFAKYLPPLLSSRSWVLRNQIIAQVKERSFVSYTGDKAEWLMLKAYRLHPLRASRHEISSSTVKNMLYKHALEEREKGSWREKVPAGVADLILKNWHVVEHFAAMEDETKRVMGMKFPEEGYH
jgi:hypothetical protein